MPDDPEQTLRDAWADVPLPDPSTIERVIANVTADAQTPPVPNSPRRRRWRGSMPLVVIVGLIALAAGVAIGTAVASTTNSAAPTTTTATPPVTAPAPGGPGFIPADGWNTVQTGVTAPPQVPSALAANYPISDTPGTYPPTATLRHIPKNGIVITLSLWSSTKGFNLKDHPVRTLPLRFQDVNARGRFEGQPATARRYFIGARINGQIVEASIFLNRNTSPRTVLPAIQAELKRIVSPSKPA